MQRIMLATDFSERSDRALRRAVLLAHQTGAVLDLLHVVDDDRPRRIVDHELADTRLLLRDLAQSLQDVDGIRCETSVTLADPFSGIVKAAAERGPDLLVLGPHRRQVLRDAFIGTTAERTIRSVDCPVLMVNGPPVGPWRHVLLTTDLSDASRMALSRFARLDLAASARCSILHVFEATVLRLAMAGTVAGADRESFLSGQRNTSRRELAEFLEGLSPLQADLHVRHDESDCATEVLTAAREFNADLLVVTAHGKSALARMVLGSVTSDILKSAEIDVLTLPVKQK
ncbi:universal stress protein [Pannonibacter sp.]|uniref:universal stress protein n=1 Tax=Pannonibacter sp. TaxID=1906786 RepID=UPI003F72F659